MLPDNDVGLSEKNVIKKIRLVNLCLSIIYKWCEKSDNLKPAYVASERLLLNACGWLVRNDYIGKQKVFLEFYKLILNWRDLSYSYVQKTHEFFLVKEGLAQGVIDHNEYCLLTFEQIGILSTVGLYQLWDSRMALISDDPDVIQKGQEAFSIADSISDCLGQLIINNPSSNSPRFDEHLIEINSALVLLYETGKFPTAIIWLKDIIEYLVLNFKMFDFLPMFNSDIEKLTSAKAGEQKSSLLINLLAEWAIILRRPDIYDYLREFIVSEVGEMNLQLWFPDKEIDKKLFTTDATRNAGSTLVDIELSENHLDFQMRITEEKVLFKDEFNSAIYSLGIDFMGFIAFRHFRTYPFPQTWRKFISPKFCFNSSINTDEGT